MQPFRCLPRLIEGRGKRHFCLPRINYAAPRKLSAPCRAQEEYK